MFRPQCFDAPNYKLFLCKKMARVREGVNLYGGSKILQFEKNYLTFGQCLKKPCELLSALGFRPCGYRLDIY